MAFTVLSVLDYYYYVNDKSLAMAQAKHGLSIGIERASNTVFLSIKAVGKLTHSAMPPKPH